MAHPLDGAKLKIVRSEKHLKSFNEEAWRYISQKPYKHPIIIQDGFVSVECVITTEPPSPLACIVGDFVTNLRASLDYVAWELFSKFKPATHVAFTVRDRERIERIERRVQFPIGSQADFAKTDGAAAHLRGTSCGIPAAAMSVIESVQPYHAGYESLTSLDQLVRIDKHRTLWLCGSFMEDMGPISLYHRDTLIFAGSGRSIKMQLAANSPALADPGALRVKVDREPTLLVALKDFPSPPTLTFVGILEDILKCVSNIIPRFEPFFL